MNFSTFNFGPQVTDALSRCGFTTPTPIQEKAIGPVLAGNDLLGLAQTGTGKTAAFVLPLVQMLLPASAEHVRALIVAPTRELAEQIHDFVDTVIAGSSLRSVVIYGGVGKQGQKNALRRGVDIVVACPGRLLDLVQEGEVDLGSIGHLVLDEADHMFDKGFLPDIRRIIKLLPPKRQSLLFSATMPDEIRHLANELLHEPVLVQVDRITSAKGVSHTLFPVEKQQKTNLLLQLLSGGELATTLVFTRTKHKARSLAVKLGKSGFAAVALQGNMSQSRRQEALDGFRDGRFTILVATDIAARGIDVSNISHVINYDIPDTTEAYIHRTGRTGRADATGEAFTFITEEDGKTVKMIERTLGRELKRQRLSIDAAVPEQQAAAKSPRHQAPRKESRKPAPKSRPRNASGSNRSAASAGEKGAASSQPAQNRRSRATSKGVFGFVAKGSRNS